jgi:heme/copper-type cytochrome/quinol oxidase subunit 4
MELLHSVSPPLVVQWLVFAIAHMHMHRQSPLGARGLHVVWFALVVGEICIVCEGWLCFANEG